MTVWLGALGGGEYTRIEVMSVCVTELRETEGDLDIDEKKDVSELIIFHRSCGNVYRDDL